MFKAETADEAMSIADPNPGCFLLPARGLR
jgi:hypothetical protein